VAGGPGQFDDIALRRDRAVHVQQHHPRAPAAPGEDVVQRRRRLALGLVHGHDLLHVQAPRGARPGVDHARDLVGHGRQVEQGLAVVFQRPDVDLRQARAGAVGVDQQADVDAVAISKVRP
jgi:hypothetical protein